MKLFMQINSVFTFN